jgi:hypothetical protein
MKVKLLLCAPKDVWGNEGTASLIFISALHIRDWSTGRGKRPGYPLNKRFFGLEEVSGHITDYKYPFMLPGIYYSFKAA